MGGGAYLSRDRAGSDASRVGDEPLGIIPPLMALPKLKDITWVTTDCYGTMIDWEKGILEAFRREATRDGFSFDEESFLNRFFEIEAEVIRGSYELYAEVLRRATVRAAKEIGWELEPSRAQFLPDSVGHWLPFRESNAAMDRRVPRPARGQVCKSVVRGSGASGRYARGNGCRSAGEVGAKLDVSGIAFDRVPVHIGELHP